MTKKAPKKNGKNGKHDKRKIPKEKRGKPTTGQSGPPTEIHFEDLTNDQRAIIKMMAKQKGSPPTSINFVHLRTKLTKLQIRNALRNLVRSGWLNKAEQVLAEDGTVLEAPRGWYQLPKIARDRLRRAEA